MVNYLYDLPRVSQNHESYATKAEVVASSEVAALAKVGLPAQNSER
jgi:malonyl-CoA decarboxylase